MIGIFEELAGWAGLFQTLVEGLSAAEIAAAGPRNSFSVLEHAWHLAELEQEAFAVRIAHLLEEESPHLPDFDGARAAEIGRYRERDLEPALATFASARAENLARLARVTPEQWACAGTLEGVGRITLADLACRMIEHDRSHAAELLESFEQLGIAPPPALIEKARAAKPAPCAA